MTFKDTLELWLKNRATTDTEFAKDFAKKNKSVDDCVRYIEGMLLNKVMEQRKNDKDNSMCSASAPSDDEVFAMALEYYHNDDIKLQASRHDMVKILSMSATTFTEEEKEQMRKEAKDWFISAEKAKLQTKEREKENKTSKADVKSEQKQEPKQVTMKPTSKPTATSKNHKGEQATQLSLF